MSRRKRAAKLLTPDEALDADLWVVKYWGNWFKVCRQTGRWRDQEDSVEKWATLAEARAEADRRNGGPKIDWTET